MNPSFLYPIKSHPLYWFHVGKSDAKQAIMGLLDKSFYTVMFDHSGELLELQERLLALPQSVSRPATAFDLLSALVETEVTRVRTKQGFADELIRVKPFRLPELQIGIDELPDELQEYVTRRRLSGPVEEDLEEALEGWKEESLFVFWWGQSFSMNCDGEVTSS